MEPIRQTRTAWFESGSLLLVPDSLEVRGISESLADSLGYFASEIIGRSLTEFIEADCAQILSKASAADWDEDGFSSEIGIKSKLGETTNFLIKISKVVDRQGILFSACLVPFNIHREALLQQKRLETFCSAATNGMISKDLSGFVTQWNRAAERMLGYKAEEMIGAPVLRIIPPDRLHEEEMILKRCLAGEAVTFLETQRRRKDGALLDVSVSSYPMKDEDGKTLGICTVLQDIAFQTKQQKELARMSRLYSALSQVNQSIVWSANQEELFNRVCRVLVEYGGFELAWIGWHNPETIMLEPVAVHGDQNDYVRNVRVFVDDRREGRGPSGRAFREERPVVCNHFWVDPTTAPWHGEARRRGIRSSAVFPIRLSGKVRGTLQVYASEAEFFQDKEVALLTEASADISFALETFAAQEARQRAEDLANAEQLFSSTMIESMPGVVYFYDSNYNFLRWNKNFERVTGYSSEEISRMTPLEFFAPEDRPELEERILEVFAKGESWIETRFRTKSGDLIDYHFTGRRVEYQGKPCLIGMGVDISEMVAAANALKESEYRHRTTLERILEGCQLLDFDYRYIFLNHAAEVQNRRPNSELLGRKITEAWPGMEDTHSFSLIRRAMEERVSCHDETDFTFPDGFSGTYELMVQPVPEGVFILSIDITERKRAERELHALNESLELKIEERTEELRQAMIRAESADKLKSAFLATMSHELRTPLNSIIGFTGILLQQLAGPLNDEQGKQLGMVQNSARHLLELITDVLDISKIEAGQFEVRNEPFDLLESVYRVCTSVQPLADRSGLQFKQEIPLNLPVMKGDRMRLEQVLLNLLSNAIKFCEVGEVSISVSHEFDREVMGHLPESGVVMFKIKDTGIGISPENIQQLFQPFKQLDNSMARQHEGTGLGLAICERLVGLMRGEISVESQKNKGSVFTVVLPVERGL